MMEVAEERFSMTTEPSLGRCFENQDHMTSIIDALGTPGFLFLHHGKNHVVDEKPSRQENERRRIVVVLWRTLCVAMDSNHVRTWALRSGIVYV